MKLFYLGLVVFLFILALFVPVVGVSNDAVGTPFFYLFIAGIVMLVSLTTSNRVVKIIFSFLILLLVPPKITSQESAIAFTMPEIDGTIRAKYEYQPAIDAGRFQVRNARFSLKGKVHPAVAYKAEIDLSDKGRIRMLDAWTRLYPVGNIHFTLGQVRVPFTIDAHRSPHKRFFANRSFIAKQVGDVRDVGGILTYETKNSMPVILEAGLFNGSGLTDQAVWKQSMSYSGKAQFFFTKNTNLTLSMQSIKPENVRINLYDIGMYYKFCNFHVEGEYLFKTYQDNLFKEVHAFNTFVFYDLKLPKTFEKITFLLRYDMMTDHNDGFADSETNTLPISDYERQRITAGVTLSIAKPFIADIRINYEDYFYKSSGIPAESEQDKIVIEFMTRF